MEDEPVRDWNRLESGLTPHGVEFRILQLPPVNEETKQKILENLLKWRMNQLGTGIAC